MKAALAIATAAALLVAAAPEALPSGNTLFWPPAQRPAGFRNMEKIFPTAVVKRGASVHPLAKAEKELDVRYTVDGKAMDTAAYMRANNVGGLLVLRRGRILLERYALGLTPDGRWTSFSVAKSITSTLVGAAIQDGYIKSLDDPVSRYIVELKGSAYDGVSIRQLMMMSSGVRWDENYEDPKSDVAQMFSSDFVSYMAGRPRETAPGSKFLYRTGDSNLMGVLVARATGKRLSQYLSEKIWAPYGMQQDAVWLLNQGQEMGGANISMTLRDYGRFGLFFAGGGVAGGKPVVPPGWTRDATAYHLPTGWGDVGYGYQWWVNKDGSYMALGIFGQTIYVDPAKQLVVVLLSAWPRADEDANYAIERAYLAAVERAVG